MIIYFLNIHLHSICICFLIWWPNKPHKEHNHSRSMGCSSNYPWVSTFPEARSHHHRGPSSLLPHGHGPKRRRVKGQAEKYHGGCWTETWESMRHNTRRAGASRVTKVSKRWETLPFPAVFTSVLL